MRSAYGRSDLFVIDEISMVSNILLARVDKRMEDVFPLIGNLPEEDEWRTFGAKSIIIFGGLSTLGLYH